MFRADRAVARAHTYTRALGVCLLTVAWLGGGCSNSPSFRVSWQITSSSSPSTTVSVFQLGDCGRAGVSGMMIGATKSDGSQDNRAVPCAPGEFEGGLGEGSWTLALVALDAQGHVKEPPASGLLRGSSPAGPMELHNGELTDFLVVTLLPLPECRDGVDNDLDGRVDLDDPDCAGNPDGPAECVAAADGVACPTTSL